MDLFFDSSILVTSTLLAFFTLLIFHSTMKTNGYLHSFHHLSLLAFITIIFPTVVVGQDTGADFWPEGKQMAISLTFDDGRFSQVQGGTQLLDTYGVKATFYVVPSAVEQQIEGWKSAVAHGHEIANHSLVHPCSGNFAWSRDHALEEYTIEEMKKELSMANARLHELLGVEVRAFAYPCGQTYIGSGKETMSYVPLIASLFASGRGWMDEAPNDPAYLNREQLTGIEMDGKDFEEVLPIIERARNNGFWLILAGHEMGVSGDQTTRLAMLEKLIQYAQKPENGIWIAPVSEVMDYLDNQTN